MRVAASPEVYTPISKLISWAPFSPVKGREASISVSLSQCYLLETLVPSLSIGMALVSTRPSGFSDHEATLRRQQAGVLVPIKVFATFYLFIVVALVLLYSTVRSRPFVVFGPVT